MRLKHICTLLLTAALLMVIIPPAVSYADAEEDGTEIVEINEQNFPDEDFRSYVSLVDDDEDGWLSEDEVSCISGIEISDVSDFKGIEYFVNLETLNINGSPASEIDLSRNTGLKELTCCNAGLESLDISENKELTELWAENASLKGLTIGTSSNLEKLRISGNSNLTALDVSGAGGLKELDAPECNISVLTLGTPDKLQKLNVTNNKQLTALELKGADNMQTLKASNCNLKNLTLAADNKLEAVEISSNSGLMSVDFSESKQLESLIIDHCALSNLDLSNNPALSVLKCDYNKLRTLNVAKSRALDELTCSNNELACLDLVYSPKKITASSNVYPVLLNPDNTFNLTEIPGYDVNRLDISGLSRGTVKEGESILRLNSQDASVGNSIVCPYQCAVQSDNPAVSTVRFQLKIIGRLPEATGSVSAKLSSYNTVNVSWSKVAGADGYKVYYRKSTAGSWSSADAAGTSTGLTKLSDGAKYFVKVVPYVTVDGCKYEGASQSTSIYTLKKTGTPAVKKYSRGKVRVSWKNIDGESGYQISRSTKKSGTSIAATYKTTSGSSKVVSAKKGRTCYYKVRAYRIVGSKKIYAPWSSAKAYKLK